MMTIKEYALHTGKSIDTIRRWQKAKKIPSEKIGRTWYILENEDTISKEKSSNKFQNNKAEIDGTESVAELAEKLKIRKDEIDIELKEQKLTAYRDELLLEFKQIFNDEFRVKLLRLRDATNKLCQKDKKAMRKILDKLLSK